MSEMLGVENNEQTDQKPDIESDKPRFIRLDYVRAPREKGKPVEDGWQVDSFKDGIYVIAKKDDKGADRQVVRRIGREELERLN